MLQLNNLSGVMGRRKVVGRGGARGGTSGRGHKGQRARTSGNVRPVFEGGQMPLVRRLPKRGFCNTQFQKAIEVINLGTLELAFAAGETVDRDALLAKGLIRGTRGAHIKLLGNGTFSKALTIVVDAASVSAVAMVERCGGKVQVVTNER